MAATISGKVFNDENHNGILDANEVGIEGVTITLFSTVNQNCISTITDASGNYSFSVTVAGSYTIYEPVTNINSECPPTNFTQPPGFNFSNGPRKITLSVTQTQINNNATLINNNFSHDTLNNPLACTNFFIQFAGIPTNWFNINLVTGVSSFFTALNPSHYVNAIGYNPFDNYIYGYDQTSNSIVRVDGNGNIITLKPNPTGLPVDGYNTGTFDDKGFLYIFVNDGTRYYTIDLRPNSPTFMKLIDPTNGYIEETSNFGTLLTPAINVSDWIFNKNDGNLYGVSNTGILHRINPTTGVTTPLTTIGATNGPFGAQAIDANGNIYAISNADGHVYKYTISGNTATGIQFSQTVITSNNDGTICPSAAIIVDFGDAPDIGTGNGPNNYNTLLISNGPRHQLRTGLTLGELITSESDAHQNSDATGDDLTLGIQDDALIIPLTPISPNVSTYSLDVRVVNNTGENANLYAWIDFNQNGIFEEIESVSANVPSVGLQTLHLTFNIPSGTVINGATFVRLRLTTDNLINNDIGVQDSRSIGPAGDGEVEDYILEASNLADLAISKTPDKNEVNAGEEITFTIKMVNNGPDSAENIQITDIIPVELLNPEFSVDGGNTFNPWPGNFFIPEMFADETRELLIRALVNNNASGTIINTTTITSTTPDSDLSNNTDSAVVSINNLADVSVVKNASPSPVVDGQEITYTITASNSGPSIAENIVISDLPVEVLSNVEFSTNNGTSFLPWPGSLDIGTLNPGNIFNFLIRAVVKNINNLDFVMNTVNITSTTPDPDLSNNTDSENTPIINLADLSLTKIADKQVVTLGETLTYTITITNLGPSTAINTVLDDQLSPSLINQEFSTDGINFIPWISPHSLGNIANGETITLFIKGVVAEDAVGTISNTANVSSDTPDPDLSNNTDSSIVAINEIADVAVTKMATPNPVNTGEILTYTIIVTNHGPSTAENIAVTDAIPSQLSNPEFSIDGGVTFNQWSGSLQIGSLLPGANSTILIRAVVVTGPNSSITNQVNVTSTTPDPDLSNNTDTIITGVNALADLAIVKTTSVNEIRAGDNIVYNLNVTNFGPSTAENVMLNDNIDSVIENPEYSLDNGNTFFPFTSPLNLGNINNGTTILILIRGMVNSNTTITTLSNTAIISSTTPDPNLDNNISTIKTPVILEADLSVTKTSLPNPAVAGSILTYTITITNLGPSDARNISVVDALPSDIINPTFSIDSGISFAPWVSPYSIDRLTSGDKFTILIQGTISPTATGNITNNVLVTSTTPDPDLSNNNDEEVTTLTPSADISIKKIALNETAKVGDIVTYKLIINNAGPDTSETIILNEFIPIDLTNREISLNNGLTFQPFTTPFNIGNLDTGNVIIVLIRGTLTNTTSSEVINRSVISSQTHDPDLTNNDDFAAVTVIPPINTADLEIIKNGPDLATIGSIITYTLMVRNLGPGIAENVVVTDLVSRALVNVQYSLDNGVTFQSWTGQLFLGTLNNNETRQIIIRGLVGNNTQGIINTATITSTTPDPNLENNTSTITTTLTSCNCNQKKCNHLKSC